jgi:hypothetical protein
MFRRILEQDSWQTTIMQVGAALFPPPKPCFDIAGEWDLARHTRRGGDRRRHFVYTTLKNTIIHRHLICPDIHFHLYKSIEVYCFSLSIQAKTKANDDAD